MATAGDGATPYGSGGVGGKFRKKPIRCSPYDRPYTALRNNSPSLFAKLVDRASRLIYTGANRLSGVFRKRLPSIAAPRPPETCKELEPSTDEGGNLGSISATNGISEVESSILKHKTFTRSEIEHLTALLHSKTAPSSDGDEVGDRAKAFEEEDVAELARGTDMGSRTPKVTPTTLKGCCYENGPRSKRARYMGGTPYYRPPSTFSLKDYVEGDDDDRRCNGHVFGGENKKAETATPQVEKVPETEKIDDDAPKTEVHKKKVTFSFSASGIGGNFPFGAKNTTTTTNGNGNGNGASTHPSTYATISPLPPFSTSSTASSLPSSTPSAPPAPPPLFSFGGTTTPISLFGPTSFGLPGCSSAAAAVATSETKSTSTSITSATAAASPDIFQSFFGSCSPFSFTTAAPSQSQSQSQAQPIFGFTTTAAPNNNNMNNNNNNDQKVSMVDGNMAKEDSTPTPSAAFGGQPSSSFGSATRPHHRRVVLARSSSRFRSH